MEPLYDSSNLPPQGGPQPKRQRLASSPLQDLAALVRRACVLCAPRGRLPRCGRARQGSNSHTPTWPSQLERYGCTGLRPTATGSTPPELQGPREGLAVQDPRHLRRKLEGALATQQAQDAFLAGLAEVVADEGMLRQALLPMVVTVQASARGCVQVPCARRRLRGLGFGRGTCTG
jgi:hypothetical protein